MITFPPLRQLGQIVMLSLLNMRASKVRIGLTILGIIIGSVCVITTFSINENMAQVIEDDLRKNGGVFFIVTGSLHSERQLAESDFQVVRAFLDEASGIFLNLHSSSCIIYFDQSEEYCELMGTTPEWMRERKVRAHRGRLLSHLDQGQRVAVLGDEVSKSLFGEIDPVGRTIRLKMAQERASYKVVGVLSSQKPSMFLDEPMRINATVFVPKTAFDELGGTKGGVVAYLRPRSGLESASLQEKILGLLGPRLSGAVRVSDPTQAVEEVRATSDDIVSAGIAIGLLCLLMGGVGIMNMMLISIEQRKREIGLYKALGYAEFHISLVFLVEAGVISFLGSLLGAAIGIPVSLHLSASVLHSTFDVNWTSVYLATVIALTVGMVFGYFPARSAAKLDPMEAIRS